MNQLSVAEERLWAHVTDKNRASLMQIRATVHNIWAPDAPRLVADFTDHGLNHCRRLVGYVEQLLDANIRRPLDEVETYILLAAIYLHDIGMQCDMPNVQRQAGVEIKATKASRYLQEDQTAIRSKHHLLTEAWLSHAYRTGKTILAPAIQTVPARLMDHLIDICKYHTKLSLKQCDDRFNYQGGHRKRLLAALLRFADEMDITSSRVNIETVIDFRLPPENAVYWWLHYFTDLNLEHNILTFHMTLCDEDIEQYGEVVRKQVVEHFWRKNDPVLDILADEGVVVRIRGEVSLDSNRFMKHISPEIGRELTGESVPLAEKLRALGDRRHDARVVCLGSVYLDLELRPVDIGALSRHSPGEWTNVESNLRIGGSAWYVQDYLNRLGCKALLASKIGAEGQDFFADSYIKPLREALTPMDAQAPKKEDNSPTGDLVHRAEKEGDDGHTAITVHLIQCNDPPKGEEPTATIMLTDTGVLRSLRWDEDEIKQRIDALENGGVLYLSGYFKTALYQDLQAKLRDLDRRNVIICLDHGRFEAELVGDELIDPLRESLKYVDLYFCTTQELKELFQATLAARPQLSYRPIEEVLNFLDEQLGPELPEVMLVRDNKGQQDEHLTVTVKIGQERVYASISVRRVRIQPECFVGVGNAFNARFLHRMLNDERCEKLIPAIVEWALCAQRVVEWVMSGEDIATTASKCDTCKKCAQVAQAQDWQANTSVRLPLFD